MVLGKTAYTIFHSLSVSVPCTRDLRLDVEKCRVGRKGKGRNDLAFSIEGSLTVVKGKGSLKMLQ